MIDVIEDITQEIIEKVKKQETILVQHQETFEKSSAEVRRTLHDHQRETMEEIWHKIQAAAQACIKL